MVHYLTGDVPNSVEASDGDASRRSGYFVSMSDNVQRINSQLLVSDPMSPEPVRPAAALFCWGNASSWMRM